MEEDMDVAHAIPIRPYLRPLYSVLNQNWQFIHQHMPQYYRVGKIEWDACILIATSFVAAELYRRGATKEWQRVSHKTMHDIVINLKQLSTIVFYKDFDGFYRPF